MVNMVAKMSPVDLVLVEGFKRDHFPKLEIHRAANGKPLIHPDDPHVVAIASDIALPQAKARTASNRMNRFMIEPPYFSNGKIRFQSRCMSATVQPLARASSRPLSSRPMDEARS